MQRDLGQDASGLCRVEGPDSGKPSQSAPEWWPDWRGKTVVCLGGGPSAEKARLEQVRETGGKLIAINNGYQLAPWADALYACDFAWWEKHCANLRDFGGLKLSGDKGAVRRTWGVKLVEIRRGFDRLELNKIGRVGWGGNSGFHVLNLAVQMRPERIVLVGYDMQIEDGLHWHGAHEGGLSNPAARDCARWRRVIDSVSGSIKALGIKVYNASDRSALTAYPKVSLEEALRC